jgi:predicted dienelactone hydrolase
MAMKWAFRIVLGIAALIAAIFVSAALMGTPERPVPDRLAGFHETTLDAPHRDVPLSVFMWYPATSDQPPELIGQNSLFYGFYAYRDAPADPVPKPVVLLSHGSGGNARGIGWLASHLATRGFVVLAFNHPETTSRDSLPSATFRIWERPDDMKALLDLAQTSLPLGISVDMERVGAVGFSLGGYSVLGLGGAEVSKAGFIDYCDRYPDKVDCGWMNASGLDFNTIDEARYESSNLDERVGVIVAIDPALPQALKEGGLDAVTVATKIVQLGETETIPEGLRWDKAATQLAQGERVVVTDTYHFAFLAECSRLGKVVISIGSDENICSDQGTRDRGEVHTELHQIIGDFLADKLGASN